MENLYGQGSEGAPPNAEDCDAGESEPRTPGGHLPEWRVRAGGWDGGVLGAGARAEGRSAGCLLPEEVDMLLQRCEGGVDVALNYAKNMAKYMKDIIGYLEKRSALGECWPAGGSAGGPRPSRTPCSLPTPLPAALQRWTLPKACRRLSTTADRASCRRWGPVPGCESLPLRRPEGGAPCPRCGGGCGEGLPGGLGAHPAL